MYTTCVEPSLRVNVVNIEPVAPLPAVGLPLVVNGGQAAAHAPLQTDLPPVSATNR